MLNNIKTKERGFTIVELLIVIVVIAILAAISIVAYNGIQNRGKASAAASLAGQIAKKAEAYNATKGSYVDLPTLKAVTTDPAEAKLDNPDIVVAGTSVAAATVGVGTATTKTAGNGEVVVYQFCNATDGANIRYWDASVPGAKLIKVGTGC